MSIGPEAARWFLDRRGIRRETLEAFGVETDGDDTTVFPYGGAKKYRKGFEKADGRKFWWDPPSQAGQLPYLPPDFEPGSHMILFEGETDTMAAWQAAPPEAKRQIVGLSGTDAWKDRYAEELFAPAKRVYVVVDNDDPYQSPDAAASVERGWQKIKAALGKKARRVTLPQGIEDAAEFFKRYDWAAFRVLLQAANEPVRYYPRLDLTKPVPDTNWLVEDLLVSGEVTVLGAEAGVGKSWIANALALAIAGGDEQFLGMRVKQHGRVMVVDEENPAELVHQRLHALGFKPEKHLENLDYLWYAGVDIANEPEKIHAEAEEIEPKLMIFDSLSRVSLGVDENSNTEMSQVFRKGLVPLARDTGAAVVVIHHTPTDNAGRPRGASAIRAAADQVISMVAAETRTGVKTGTINIFPSKPRRQLEHLKARICGDMEKDGWVRVEREKEESPY